MKFSASTGFRCIVINPREIAIVLDMGWKAPCITNINFIGQTVTTNTTVNSRNLLMQNVTVRQGNKLTVNACGTITINPGFTVETGAGLEINMVRP